MKTLRMKSLKANMILIVLFLVLSVVMFAVALPMLAERTNQPLDLETIDFTGDIEGLRVTGTLYGVYDWYVEEELDGKIVGKEFLIDADDYYYIGLHAQYKDMDKADKLMDASWDYLDGITEYEDLEAFQYTITGTIKKMPADSLAFLYEYIEWDALDDESREMFLPYYIELEDNAVFSDDSPWGFILMGALFAVIAIVFLVYPLTGACQKSIKKYLKQYGNSDMATEKVENFLQNTTMINNLCYNNEFICGQCGSTTAFGEINKLVWVYLHTVTHKRYFITVGKTYSLMLGFTDGSIQEVTMKKEAHAHEHMQQLSVICPHTIFGYTDDLNNLFHRDMNSFMNLKYNENINNI